MIKKRSAAVLALAIAGALAATGVALAAGSSTASFTFSPTVVTKIAYKPGKIAFHTHTNYTQPGQFEPWRRHEEAAAQSRQRLQFRPGAAPNCIASLSGKDMAQAMAPAACGNAMIGSGTASALHTALPATPAIHGCVLAFDRPDNRALLFLRIKATNPSSIDLHESVLQPPGHHDRAAAGRPRDRAHSAGTTASSSTSTTSSRDPSHPNASPFPLADLDVSIQRGSYVNARCFDADRTWNMQTKFTYNDNTTQTRNSTTTCLVA